MTLPYAILWFILGALALRIGQAVLGFRLATEDDDETDLMMRLLGKHRFEGIIGHSEVHLTCAADAPVHEAMQTSLRSIELPKVVPIANGRHPDHLTPDGRVRGGKYRADIRYAVNLTRME